MPSFDSRPRSLSTPEILILTPAEENPNPNEFLCCYGPMFFSIR